MPSGYDLVAGDHDFHVCNLTPSVTLLTDIKAHPDGNGDLPSLYKGDSSRLTAKCCIISHDDYVVVNNRFAICVHCVVGTVHVYLKDSIFQASSPTRHTAELGMLIKKSTHPQLHISCSQMAVLITITSILQYG